MTAETNIPKPNLIFDFLNSCLLRRSDSTMTTLIKLRFSTADRYSKTRTFKTLKGARKWAHEMIGAHPDISLQFRYAVGMYGDSKIEIREGTTFAELFPGTAGAENDPDMGSSGSTVSPGELRLLSESLLEALIAACRRTDNEASRALLAACEAELARREAGR